MRIELSPKSESMGDFCLNILLETVGYIWVYTLRAKKLQVFN